MLKMLSINPLVVEFKVTNLHMYMMANRSSYFTYYILDDYISAMINIAVEQVK